MKFGVVCKFTDPVVLENMKSILELIKNRGHKFELEKGAAELLKLKTRGMMINKMTSDIIISIGDDATILRTFRELKKKKIPVLGVSCGATSFLAEVNIKNFELTLKKIEKKKYFIEERSRLAVEVNGKILPFALNELTVSASRGATLVRYALKINGELIFRDSADGVIVATPTGSTGYALSAGGPVVSNISKVFLIIPICSTYHNKPFIVSDNSEIIINDILSSVACEAVVDGRYRMVLDKNVVKIRRAKIPAHFIKFEKSIHSRVFNKLRKKFEVVEKIPRDAPPSAKFIYKILQYEGPLTQKEIATNSMLPNRTVRSALNYLTKIGLILKQPSLRDARQSIYFVKSE
jgi:NAD+ kinase